MPKFSRQTILNTPLGEFRISSKYEGSVLGFPLSPSDRYPHNKFRIAIKHLYKTVYFNFYGSYHDYQEGVVTMEPRDHIEAFDAILGDAVAGSYSSEEFISEFGYPIDEPADKRRATKIWKECQKTLVKIESLGPSLDDIYKLSNWLREKYEI